MKLDAKPVQLKEQTNSHSNAWVVRHEEAKTLKCHSAKTKWFGQTLGENAKEKAEETR